MGLVIGIMAFVGLGIAIIWRFVDRTTVRNLFFLSLAGILVLIFMLAFALHLSRNI